MDPTKKWVLAQNKILHKTAGKSSGPGALLFGGCCRASWDSDSDRGECRAATWSSVSVDLYCQEIPQWQHQMDSSVNIKFHTYSFIKSL